MYADVSRFPGRPIAMELASVVSPAGCYPVLDGKHCRFHP